MMNKENDLFLNMLYNPDMSLLDLKRQLGKKED